ncbi:C2H2-like zinc finger protein, partial [Prunus dulcis]
ERMGSSGPAESTADRLWESSLVLASSLVTSFVLASFRTQPVTSNYFRFNMMSEDGLSIPSTIKGLAQELNPDAEVIALSPKSLMATNRFVCEICNKGFQRDQNLQLHRRGHNLPWKLKQRSNKEVIRKKVYVCPERTCVHHEPSRALGDLTGIKKHFSRKHGEKKWKCEKCSKKYAVQSDWKAHSKVCGTREYRCDCGTLFFQLYAQFGYRLKDSFITHRAFCDALAAEESARFGSASTTNMNPSFINGGNNITNINPHHQPPRIPHFIPMFQQEFAGSDPAAANNSHLNSNAFMAELLPTASMDMFGSSSSSQTQWLINNTKFPEEASFNLSMSSSSLARGLKEELEESKGTTTIRDGSLFSSSFLSNKHLMNMPGAANLIKQSQSEQSSLTRDFLGVGGDAISGVPFFQQELAKLASMGDLSQYTSSGHQ